MPAEITPTKRKPGRPRKVDVTPPADMRSGGILPVTDKYVVSHAGMPPREKAQRTRNIKAHGFASPREHFIYGPADIALREVATRWNIPYVTLLHWSKVDEWRDLKDEHLKSLPITQGGAVVTQGIAEMREEWVKGELEDYVEARTQIKARLAETTEEVVSPSGQVVKVTKRAASFRSDVAALRDVHEGARVALGLHTKLTGAFAGANIDNSKNLTQYVVQAPSDVPALPGPALPVVEIQIDVPEGEVTES